MDWVALILSLLTIALIPLHAQGNQGIKLQQTILDGDVTLVTEEGFLPFLPHSTWRVGILLNTPLADPFYNVYKGLLFRGNYILPTLNSTTAQHDRSKRKTQGLRWTLYSMIEEALNRAGVEGRGCFLRALCEAAAATLHHDGLVGQILHLILTPSSTNECSTSEWHRKYEDAESWGLENGDCSIRYADDCPCGALENFTTLL